MKNISQWVQGKLWVHFQGRTFVYEPSQKSSRKKGGHLNSGGQLTAPMPGKITKIFKFVGDSVSVGDSIIVMEAMKMEYTLKANSDGKILQINAQVGDQVQLGKLLANIEEVKK